MSPAQKTDYRQRPRHFKPYYGSERSKDRIKSLPTSGRKSNKSTATSKGILKHLNYLRFRFLPAGILIRICSFLHPRDLLALARTNRELREKFTDRNSKPYWNATRNITGMPNWKTVSFPEAAAFFYDRCCQATECTREGEFSALYLCRRYCIECAKENLLNLDEVRQLYPDIPELLVKRLPWNSRRCTDEDSNIRKDRFYLKSDLVKLQWRMRTIEPVDEEVIARLKQELSSLQTQRKNSTFEVERWYDGDLRLRRSRRFERWPIITNVMISRWDWSPVEYAELKGRLKSIVDHLLDIPVLSESVWDSVRGDIWWAIKQNRKVPQHGHPRPFSL